MEASEHEFTIVNDSNGSGQENALDETSAEDLKKQLELLTEEQKKNQAKIDDLKAQIETVEGKTGGGCSKWRACFRDTAAISCKLGRALVSSRPFLHFRRGLTLSLTVLLVFLLTIAAFCFAMVMYMMIGDYLPTHGPLVIVFVSCTVLGLLYPDTFNFQRHKSKRPSCTCKTLEEKKND